MKQIVISGGGFAGLAAAATSALAGNRVILTEKNAEVGGRARMFHEDGFSFDMGPSWYWMPDVFEKFYNQFGYTTSDFYELKRLDPSYTIVWNDKDNWQIPAGKEAMVQFFEKIESGAGKKLIQFLNQAAFKYRTGMEELVYKPGLNLSELVDIKLIKGLLKMDVFKSMSSHVRKYFKHPGLIQLCEFPVLFLGATSENTPAIYSLMNYADIELGTWYPMGGMVKIVEAMKKICIEYGVEILTEEELIGFSFENRRINQIHTNKGNLSADALISAGDYHHFDQKITPEGYRMYSSNYWNSRTLAPSALIYYVGLNRKLDKFTHHTLFFDADFPRHSKELYTTKIWPSDPLFYVCTASKTDPTIAPKGMENIFILIPVSAGLHDSETIRKDYFEKVIQRMEKFSGHEIKKHIVYLREYAASNFIQDYYSFKGNAYGLANTLKQTANLKPKMKSKHFDNLFFAGQLTVPGPGVPPSIISGIVASKLVDRS